MNIDDWKCVYNKIYMKFNEASKNRIFLIKCAKEIIYTLPRLLTFFKTSFQQDLVIKFKKSVLVWEKDGILSGIVCLFTQPG